MKAQQKVHVDALQVKCAYLARAAPHASWVNSIKVKVVAIRPTNITN
jgi:hypothetical protein